MSPATLIAHIVPFSQEASEGGRRAQAVVAGLLDVFAGAERVDVRRVNDPSRSVPGDVNVRSPDLKGWEKIFEVRDKPITREDLYVLIRKCQETGVADAVMVALSTSQATVPVDEAKRWAAERGVNLTTFFSWTELIGQALFWAGTSSFIAAAQAPARIEQRLIELEVAEASVQAWAERFSEQVV